METLLEKYQVRPSPKPLSDITINFAQKQNKPSSTIQEIDLDDLLSNEDQDKMSVYDNKEDINVIIEDKTKLSFDFDFDKFRSKISNSVFHKEMLDATNVVNNIGFDIASEESMDVEKQGIDQQPQKRRTKPVNAQKRPKIQVVNVSLDQNMKMKVPRREDMLVMKRPSYYMNNRQIFSQFINQIFGKYRDELNNINNEFTCDSIDRNEEFKLLLHQKIVRDYLNIYTPYRGLLLYHGLGSGKTCSSIAIAEAFNSLSAIALGEGITKGQQVVILVPASLRTNFYEELKKCGNPIFKKNQYWKFISIKTTSGEINTHMKEQLVKALHLPSSFIEKYQGAFMVDVNKETNYEELSGEQKRLLDKQIDEMIQQKYLILNYNGLRKARLMEMTNNMKNNIFDNKVVIVDEAHNFISRIVNKINKERANAKPTNISTQLYDMLMSASNARVVLLTGTPIINYPNEIGICYNILRGYIKSWRLSYDQKENVKQINYELISSLMKQYDSLDYLEVTNNEIIFTRNPYGFENKFYNEKYSGVDGKQQSRRFMNDKNFIEDVLKLFHENDIKINKSKVKVEKTKALPDRLENFQQMFIDNTTGKLKNENIFKRRILGLTSYFRSAQESLMPSYDVNSDHHIVKIPMSNFQASKYEQVRLQEIKLEKNNRMRRLKNRTKELYEDATSSYRIFSRAFCNFVFPDSIGRPMPNDNDNIDAAVENMKDEDDLDALNMNLRKEQVDGRYLEDDLAKKEPDEVNKLQEYNQRIQSTLMHLRNNMTSLLNPESLESYSPKFLHLLENITNKANVGSHLIYSQFRTLEGIGIFSLVLEANGFVPFKLKRNSKQEFVLDIPIEQRKRKRMFALYTGTETTEEKEVLRNVFNGNWTVLSTQLREEVEAIYKDNLYGDIIKVFMITSSGAEGISLKNVRYVHIMEPYWHPVRKEQVIGRARRICSHDKLPESERNIKVFLYLMTFSDEQLKSQLSIGLKNNDKSKFGNSKEKRPLTSDESLNEIMNMKENITQNLLKAVKEASVDCGIHIKANNEESLECFSFGNVMNSKLFSYKPNIEYEDQDSYIEDKNKKQITWGAVEKVIDGKPYALRLDESNKPTNMLYDINTFIMAQKNPKIEVHYIGRLIEENGKTYIDGNL